MREAKDALIVSREAVIAELRERAASKAAQPDVPDELDNRIEALLAQQLAARDTRLLKLEAAISASSSIASCEGSSSSSSSAALQIPPQKRACSSPRLAQALEKDEILDEIFSFVGRKEWLYAGVAGT
jgi:hypothetical protein